MRIEILNHLSDEVSKITSRDVLTMCNDYVFIDIPSCFDDCIEEHKPWTQSYTWNKEWNQNYILLLLSSCFISKKEYFIAYTLLNHLVGEVNGAETDRSGNDLLSYYHSNLGYTIFKWNRNIINDVDATKKVMSHYQRAIKLNPTKERFRRDYCEFLMHIKQYDSAISEYLQMNVISEDNYYSNIGSCYECMNDMEKATDNFLTAMVSNPSSVHHVLRCAEFFTRMKEFDQAKKYYLQAIEMKPDDPKIYHELAKMLRDYAQKYDESRRYYLKCLQLTDNKKYNGSYGYLLYLMGEYEEAIKYIQIQMTLDDKDHWAVFYFGMVQRALGHNKEAEIALSKASKLMRRKTFYNEILKQIKLMGANDNTDAEYLKRLENIVVSWMK